jgi:hypothetical protein
MKVSDDAVTISNFSVEVPDDAMISVVPDDPMTISIFSVEVPDNAMISVVPDDPMTISIFSVEVPDGTSFARLASSSFWSSSAHFGNRDAYQTKPNRAKQIQTKPNQPSKSI